MTFTHPKLLQEIQKSCPELMEKDCIDGAQHYCPNCGSGISLSEPQLHHVLRALSDKCTISTYGGEMLIQYYSEDDYETHVYWNLSTGLYSQKPEVLDFLESLLVGKK